MFGSKTIKNLLPIYRTMPKYKTITERNAKIKVPAEQKISKDLPVFYNPIMKFNRDVSILLFNVWEKEDLRVALPLAGTGIRGIRLLKETKNIDTVFFNDGNPEAIKIIEENLKLNKIKDKATVSNHEASRFLFSEHPFDYIDIDPFGTPNPFLDAAVKKLALQGILAVTATDTSALCGAYTNACRRKYWATPKNNHLMHETGLRILIRKVQLIALQFEKALTPIIAYSKDHYMRVFFSCKKSKTECTNILKQHGLLDKAGPLWLGPIQDQTILKKMVDFLKQHSEYADAKDFIETLNKESQFPAPGFIDIHETCKRLKISAVPKFDNIMENIKKQGHKVAKTHLSKYGIRTDMEKEEFEQLLKNF